MAYAGITGWGKCLPHGVLTNADLASFLDTSDDWIVSRTGIGSRRIADCLLADMAEVAAARALACAGLEAADLDPMMISALTWPQVCRPASGLGLALHSI